VPKFGSGAPDRVVVVVVVVADAAGAADVPGDWPAG
jgi:hypothetical protein